MVLMLKHNSIGWFQVFGVVERAKYYALWTLTEGASILTGLGFTGYAPNGASLWQGAANVNIFNIEFGPNFKVCCTARYINVAISTSLDRLFSTTGT